MATYCGEATKSSDSCYLRKNASKSISVVYGIFKVLECRMLLSRPHAFPYLVLSLSLGPNLQNTGGTSTKRRLIQASKLVAQSTPSLSYI